MERVEQFASEYDLSVTEVDLGRRTVSLSGTVANMNEAFGTEIRLYQSSAGTFRGRTGALFVPADLAPIVTGVFGLDNRPQTKTRFRRLLRSGPRRLVIRPILLPPSRSFTTTPLRPMVPARPSRLSNWAAASGFPT